MCDAFIPKIYFIFVHPYFIRLQQNIRKSVAKEVCSSSRGFDCNALYTIFCGMVCRKIYVDHFGIWFCVDKAKKIGLGF